MAIQKIIRRTPSNSTFFGDTRSIGQSVTNQFEEALVADCIINDEHELYSVDGYNVGSIQFKFVTSNAYTPNSQLSWAFPLDGNITSYPLKNEIVNVVSILNRFYYVRVNINNQLSNQSFPELGASLKPIPSTAQDVSTTRERQASPAKQKASTELLGSYFIDNPKNYRLKHFEGDVIFEGRTGQSIRFGSAWKNNTVFTSVAEQSPSLLLRVTDVVGTPTVDTPNGLIIEDINNDSTSMWLTADQTVPLKLSSDGTQLQTASTKFPSKYDGAQVVINSNRLVLNSKKESIVVSSAKEINHISMMGYTIDTDGDFVTWTNKDRRDRVFGNWSMRVKGDFSASVSGNVLFIGKKFYLGGQSGSQPMVLGKELVSLLASLIDTITGAPIVLMTSKSGLPSKLNPITKAKLKQVKAKLNSMLSADNFVTKNNAPKSLGSYKES